ncbi:MAG: hypothetical protein CL912_17560 [Deltaproteobacteria bacterium]|nr:hypothetical protein [Deltaproteobacteria bacterium]
MLTILTLSMDPFTQQILELQIRPSTAVNNLNIAPTVEWSKWYNDLSKGWPGDDDSTLDLQKLEKSSVSEYQQQ